MFEITRARRLLAIGLLIALLGCGEDGSVCRVGESIACTGRGGCSGFQVCREDGSGFDPCVCDVPDAGFDASMPPDAGAEPDGGSDAGTPDPDAGGEADGGMSDAGGDRPPWARCNSGAVLFPDPMTISGEASDPDDDLISAIAWRLASAPSGSSASFTDPGTPSFTFTPDVAGYYEFCLTVEAGGLESEETCCRYSSAASFEWSFVTTRSTRYVEEVELSDGRMEFSFDVNQGFSRTTGTYAVSDSSWSVIGTGGATSALRVSVQPQVDRSVSDTSAVSAGDEVTLTLRGDPFLTGPSDSVVTGTIALATAPDPGAPTPRIVALETGPLFASTPARISVQFDPARSPGDRLTIGGWNVPRSSIAIADDGAGDDPVAGDGWYSGRFTVPPSGEYDVLVLPRADGAFGPYYRDTITVP